MLDGILEKARVEVRNLNEIRTKKPNILSLALVDVWTWAGGYLAARKEELTRVTSKDGTLIAYWRSGYGPPLVLVLLSEYALNL